MAFQNVVYSVCGHGCIAKQDRILKLVTQYNEYREIFKNNQEINQDFEVLESVAVLGQDHVFSREPQTLTLANLMLICQRDGVVITLYHIFRGIINFTSYWKEETSFRAISNTLSTLIKFTIFVRDFMTKSFLEMTDLTDEVDQLIADADNYVKNVCHLFMKAMNKIVFTMDAVEKVFPSDEEYRSRLEFGVGDLVNLNDENVAILAEQVIVCALRGSFVLILSYSRLSSSDPVKDSFLVSKAMELQNQVQDLLSQCEKASEEFNNTIQTFLKDQADDKTKTTVKGLSIPLELRFSSEVNLYENTIDMIDRTTEITNILQIIRSDSVKVIIEKSKQVKGDPNTSSSSINTSNLQKLQDELDQKIQYLLSLTKLESQIISKVCCEKSSKSAVSSPQKCPPPNLDNFEEPPVENVSEEDEGGECTYYMVNSNEPTETSLPENPQYEDHEGMDELFELVTCRANEFDDEFTNDNDVNQIGDAGVLEARQVVFEQLKTVLKPRHDIMKSREEEAYKRAYGERTVPEEEEQMLVKKTKKCDIATLKWEVDPNFDEEKDNDDDEIEDQVAEEENNLFSFDFKNRLDSILQKGAGSSY